MRKILKILAVLAAAAAVVVALFAATVAVLTPWMDRWGATDEEIAAVYPGDELVPNPVDIANRAITIQAPPQQVYPWLLQLGAGRGGLYSYTALEALIGCPIVNADRIHPEWQDLKPGDEVKLCPHDPAPPPYIVAQVIPDRALVLGHKDGEEWVEVWQFNLVPQADGSTRLVQRTRTTLAGGFWAVLHPVTFVMERRMLYGIKERVEGR